MQIPCLKPWCDAPSEYDELTTLRDRGHSPVTPSVAEMLLSVSICSTSSLTANHQLFLKCVILQLFNCIYINVAVHVNMIENDCIM